MNTLDLIVCLVLALAVWNGWRQGFVVQICSLAGIVAGIWIAARFGAQVGGWLRLDDEVAAAGGFVTALVAVILVVAIAGSARSFTLRDWALPTHCWALPYRF